MDFVVKTAAESEDARKGVKQQIDIQGALPESLQRCVVKVHITDQSLT